MKIFYKRKQMLGFAFSAAIVSNSLVVGNATGLEISEVNKEDIEKGNEVIESQLEECEELGVRSIERSVGETYKVIVDSLNVRTGPSTSHSLTGSLKKGTEVAVQSISNGWAKISYNGNVAYCNANSKYLEKVSTKMKVTVDVLNVRTGPSTSHSLLGSLKVGTIIEVQSVTNGWAKINFNGKVGYCNANSKYLQAVAGATTNTTTNTTTNVVSSAKLTEDVNLRKTASWSGTKLMVIKKGSVVEVLSKGTEWTKIKYNGTVGYVTTQYIGAITNSGSTSNGTTSNENMVTVKDATWLRKTDSWSAEKLVLLQKDAKAEYISRTSDWIKVKYNGTVGYITADYVLNVPEVENESVTELKKYKVTTDSLNVRSGPGTNYSKVGSVTAGQIIEVYSVTSGWAKIKYNSTTAYVSVDYITAYNESDTNTSVKGKKVYLDPGHGGSDAGAIGKTYGTKEKDVALDVTKRVASKLRDKGYIVAESRTTDVYPSLSQRSNDANSKGSDIFVSMHFNSATATSAQGLETLYKVDARTSNVLADQVQDEMIAATGLRNRGLKQRSDLAVLNRTTMPAILVEGGFLSNSTEENLIKSASYRETLANAIVKGIEDYFKVAK